MTVREKIVRSILETYSPSVPQQHQTFVNEKAERLLKAIAMNANLDFSATILCQLILD
jgi:hypothetical protein